MHPPPTRSSPARWNRTARTKGPPARRARPKPTRAASSRCCSIGAMAWRPPCASSRKRAVRRGLTPPTWTWGTVSVAKECIPVRGDEPGAYVACRVARIALTIVGDAPHYAGWTFAAALTHLDGENLVRGLPGTELPRAYRTAAPACDHCRAARRRAETYVLTHEDGRHAQVGSTCIEDFLGSPNASKLAHQASLLAAFRGVAEDGLEGGSGGRRTTFALREILPAVAWCVREQGWISHTRAREGCVQATADEALRLLTDDRYAEKLQFAPTEADAALGDAAAAWAEELTDAAVDAERGDYLHNVRAAARSGVVTARSLGIAASIVVAYQRSLGADRAAKAPAGPPRLDVHVGAVGQRLAWSGASLEGVAGFETDFGYTTVLRFRSAEGALLVWKASNTDLGRDDVGKTYDLKGTVTKHDVYQGRKQTIVARCKIAETRATTEGKGRA